MRHVIALTAAFALLIAPAAGALIVVQKSIAGVRLGMTAKQVRDVLGKPDKVTYPHDEIQGSVKVYRYGLTKITLSRGRDGTVQMITTRSKRQRTSDDVGVGSSEVAVRAHVKNVKCETSFGVRSCHVGEFAAGRRVTDFAISKAGKVTRVTLGLVID